MRESDKNIIFEMVRRYGKDALCEKLNMHDTIAALATAGALIGGMHKAATTQKLIDNAPIEIVDDTPDYVRKIYQLKKRKDGNFQLSPNFQEKADAVRRIMEVGVKNQDRPLSYIELDEKYLVYMSEKYDMDIVFILAMLWQESAFGSSPLARRTHNPISYGLQDTGIRKFGWRKNQNDVIEPYIRTILFDYLGENPEIYPAAEDEYDTTFEYRGNIAGKTIFDLMKDKGFVDYKGDRWATDPKYESSIRWLYDHIIELEPCLEDTTNNIYCIDTENEEDLY